MTTDGTDPFAPDSATVIWRFMEECQFDDLLKPFNEQAEWRPPREGATNFYTFVPGNLWLAYSSFVGDDLEGKMPAVNRDPELYLDRAKRFLKLSLAESAAFRERFGTADHSRIRKGFVNMADLCGSSCWTMNGPDDWMMWNFAGDKNGVAIRSTVVHVFEALDTAMHRQLAAEPTACAVGYVDHDTFFLPHDGFRGLLSIVSSCWSDQSEIRFVAKSARLAAIPSKLSKGVVFTSKPHPEAINISEFNPTEFEEPFSSDEIMNFIYGYIDQVSAAINSRKATGKKGFHLPVCLEKLIAEVVVSSSSDDEYVQKVTDQLKAVGVTVPVIRSSV